MDFDAELERQNQMIEKAQKTKKQPKAGKTGKLFDSAQHELEKKKKNGDEPESPKA
jgi:hypothetical protein